LSDEVFHENAVYIKYSVNSVLPTSLTSLSTYRQRNSLTRIASVLIGQRELTEIHDILRALV